MDQKRRNTIALVSTLILVPILAVLIVADIKAIRAKRRPRDKASETAAPAPPSVPAPPLRAANPATPSDRPTATNIEVQREQQRMASLLPKRNPFYVPKRTAVLLAPAPAALAKTSAVPEKPVAIVVNGILSPRGSTERTAFINGRLCRAGEVIGGWTVVKINTSDVTLDNGEKRITVGIRQQ